MRLSDDPNSSSMYDRRAGFSRSEGIWERVVQMGSKIRYICVYLSLNGRVSTACQRQVHGVGFLPMNIKAFGTLWSIHNGIGSASPSISTM